MAIAAKLAIYRDKELKAALKRLEGSGVRRAIRAGLMAAARVTRKAVKAAAPDGRPKGIGKVAKSKKLKNRIIVKSVKLRPGELGAVAVKTRAPHAHLLEKGTKQRKTKAGRSTGATPATHFQERATKASSGAAAAAFAAAAKKAIERIAMGGK